MNEEQAAFALWKGLEVWGLTVLTDLAIVLSLVVMAMILARGYLEELEKHLTLRVGLEVWRLSVNLFTDLSLSVAVVIGLLVTNPDIFADIKVPLPFFPAATLCLAVALVLRIFYGGRARGTKAYGLATVLIMVAVIVNLLGYTFAMESAGEEWLVNHPSAFWSFLDNLKSNKNLGLSMTVFWICGPLLYAVLVWSMVAGLRRSVLGEKKETV